MEKLYYSQSNTSDNTTLWNNDNSQLIQYVANAYNEYVNETTKDIEK